MNTTTRVLCPPNLQVLNADVICSVTERAHPTYYLTEDPVPELPRNELSYADRFPTKKQHSMDMSEHSSRYHDIPIEFSSTVPTTEKKTKKKYPSAWDIDPGFETQPVTDHTELTKNKNQSRQRDYQRRYRAKREAYRITLENETRKLQNEIEQLKVQRTKDTLWAMVAEYFSLLQQSVNSRSPLSSLNAVHNADRLVMKRTYHS